MDRRFSVLTTKRPTIDLLSQTHSTEEMFSAASFSGLVEFSTSFSARPQISHVVFDFDRTIAWLKHGWPDIMALLIFGVARQTGCMILMG
jgi:hypothetical protein